MRSWIVRGLSALLVLGSLGAAACSGGAEGSVGPAIEPATSVPTPHPPVAAVAPSGAGAPMAQPTFDGPDEAEALDPAPEGAVLAMQQRLEGLGFWLGEPDGELGTLTAQAVLAFQKAIGLTPDGKAGPVTLAALESAVRPVPNSMADGIEIQLDRQLLFVIASGEVRWVLNTSTGATSTPTRAGDFSVQRRVDGVREAPLGSLYRPAYFDGGIAIHGSPSIPAYPASHGCARVSNPAMDMLWASNLVELGTPVRVV